MQIEPLEYYRILEPEWARTIGQGPRPSGLTVTRDGVSRTISFGAEVRASETCDPDGGIANTDSDPILVRCWVLEGLPDHQIEHLPDNTSA